MGIRVELRQRVTSDKDLLDILEKILFNQSVQFQCLAKQAADLHGSVRTILSSMGRRQNRWFEKDKFTEYVEQLSIQINHESQMFQSKIQNLRNLPFSPGQ